MLFVHRCVCHTRSVYSLGVTGFWETRAHIRYFLYSWTYLLEFFSDIRCLLCKCWLTDCGNFISFTCCSFLWTISLRFSFAVTGSSGPSSTSFNSSPGSGSSSSFNVAFIPSSHYSAIFADICVIGRPSLAIARYSFWTSLRYSFFYLRLIHTTGESIS